MPVDIVVSPSDGFVYNKGSSTIENRCVNRYLQSNQFASKHIEVVEEEETEDGENRRLTDSVYNASDVF